MDSSFPYKTRNDPSVPPPPGLDDDYPRRDSKYDSRSRFSSRDYDRDRSRHERNRESRFDRDDYSRSSYSDDRRNYDSYRDIKDSDDSYRGRSRDSDSRYDRRSYRDRSRGRDRSRDRDRDRGKDRSRDRDRDRHWDREKAWDREPDYRDDIPNNTILIRGIPPHVTEEDIRAETNRYTLYPQDIVLPRKKHTGESRGFAFAEFRMLSDAVRWKELTQGVLYFGQSQATIHYYVQKDLPPERTSSNRADWTCIKCGVNNFRKRTLCFKCNAPREEAELNNLGGEGYEEVSNSPSSTLLFRNLDILTTEERVLSMLGQITVLPIKNLKVAKDSLTNTSRGFAYVELHSISEAMQLHDLLLSMTGNFFVDGRRVTVSYSKRALSTMNTEASANAASVALAAAQWTNQDVNYGADSKNMFSDSVLREKQMESVQSLNSGSCGGYQNTPDITTYQYDESSGYYYDSITGYYYDPNSQYYYNSETRQYLYWDIEKQTYMCVPTTENYVTSAVIQAPAVKAEKTTEVVISSPPVIAHAPVLTKKEEEKPKVKVNSQDKVKIAKKVAKDMEKWAKTLNQKKENSKLMNSSITIQKPVPVEETSGFFDVISVPEKKKNDVEIDVSSIFEREVSNGSFTTNESKEKSLAALAAAYGGESDSEVESDLQDEGSKAQELMKVEEAKLIDWDKLACLLCKRQFPSKEVLTKHVQLSDLHKQNVDMLKLTKLTPRQLQELEKKETGYRDRAKERRQKFGQPDVPPVSRLKARYMKERKEAFLPPEPPVEAIGSDNIGNKMLKAMGWTEGQGLGKKGQGMSGIIEVQRRVKSAGLGMKGAAYGANASDSYKDAVRKSMQQRYNEIA